jgi:uncharacterized membrane protein YphA (DoxX/SURF4 family)
MLNPFPELLSFGYGSYFLVPALLRITVAAVFVYLALTHFKNKKVVASELTMVSHEMAIWAVGVAILLEFGIAALLFVGAYTQIAAILAALGGIKALILKKRFPNLYPLSALAYTFVAIISLSLLLTGAGAFAFDLPL